ncbi:hypothetical protein GCM10028799_54940 [Kribbella italica]
MRNVTPAFNHSPAGSCPGVSPPGLHLRLVPRTQSTNDGFAKIGARHRAEAVRYAYRHGIAEA